MDLKHKFQEISDVFLLTMQLNLTFQIDSRIEQFKGSRQVEERMKEILLKMDNFGIKQIILVRYYGFTSKYWLYYTNTSTF